MNLSNLNDLVMKYAKKFSYGERVRPLRDWWVIVCVALVLLTASAGWSYWLFRLTSNGQAQMGAVVPQQQTGTNSLDAVKTIFSTRASEKAHYLSDYHFVDPSH